MMPIYSSPGVEPASNSQDLSCGGRLVATDGRELPLQSVQLRVEAGSGEARTVLVQRFSNPHDEPLHVRYQVPLPADGAVSGYNFVLGERRIHGEVDKKQRARERFEEAILDGHSAALLDEERSSLFTQELGNVPPKSEVQVELTVDQPLVWTEQGWEYRFPTVVAPRYQGAPGRTPDASQTMVAVADGDVSARAELQLSILDETTAPPVSPSHALRAGPSGSAYRRAATDGLVQLAEGAHLDRDVVIRWQVRQPAPGVSLEAARPAADKPRSDHAYGLLTIVPPVERHTPVSRDLVVLLDTSGSMSGEPLAQAVRLVSALVSTLSERDTLELVEFSWRPSRWKKSPTKMDAAGRDEAISWLKSLRAGGGTEMRSGIEEALRPLRGDAQRQIVLVSDGLIGFEQEILRTLKHQLPASCRFHCMGVGHGVNRTLTQGAARAGRGVEVVVAPGEDVEPAMKRMLARTDLPLVVDVELSGSALAASGPTADLYDGSPAKAAVMLHPAGGELRVRGRAATGFFEETIQVPATAAGEGSGRVLARYAREQVEELELLKATGENVDRQVESLGLDFQISTRLTSWVAISDEQTVDPTKPTRRVEQPHERARGMSAEGIGLRAAAAPMAYGGAAPAPQPAMMPLGGFAPPSPAGMAPPPGGPPPGAPPPRAEQKIEMPEPKRKRSLVGRLKDALSSKGRAEPPVPPAPAAPPPARRPAPTKPRGISTGAPPPADESFRREKAELELDDLESEAFLSEETYEGGPTRAGGLRRPELQGRIRLHTETRLVVSAVAVYALRLELPERAQVTLADGSVVTVEVERNKSTQGTLKPGQELKLSLRLSAALTSPPVSLDLPAVTITLSP